MDNNDLDELFESCVADIQHELILFDKNLRKAKFVKAAARRCRLVTVNLAKLFKKFRKITCDMGLK